MILFCAIVISDAFIAGGGTGQVWSIKSLLLFYYSLFRRWPKLDRKFNKSTENVNFQVIIIIIIEKKKNRRKEKQLLIWNFYLLFFENYYYQWPMFVTKNILWTDTKFLSKITSIAVMRCELLEHCPSILNLSSSNASQVQHAQIKFVQQLNGTK